MIEQGPNLYEFLGVNRKATQDEIIQAFRKKAAALQPDNVGTAESSNNLQMLGQAYRTLTDPQRRREYDATLPPVNVEKESIFNAMPKEWLGEKESSEEAEEAEEKDTTGDPIQRKLRKSWKKVGKQFFERADRYTPALDGVRSIIPLTIDKDTTALLGYDPANANLIGYLDTSEMINLLRKLLSDAYGKTLEIRLIPVTTVEEWVIIRDAEERVKQKQTVRSPMAAPRISTPAPTATAPAPRAMMTSGGGWEQVISNIEGWLEDGTTTVQDRARFILQCVMMIEQAEDRDRNAGVQSDTIQQNLHMVLSRLARITGVDPTLVALEYVRYKMK